MPLPSPRAFAIAHRAARFGRADGARAAAGRAPRGSARAVAVPCIIGPSSAREPCDDARSSRRALDPPRLDGARDASAETLADGRAREDARGVGRSGRGRRASRENVQAREPTAGVSCERAAPRASRGVSRSDPRDAASSDKSARDTFDIGSRQSGNTLFRQRTSSRQNRVNKECTGTQNALYIDANSPRGHIAQQTFCEKLSRPYLLILDYESKRRSPL